MHLCSDDLFEELKEKDDKVRGKKLAILKQREEESESPRLSMASKSPGKGVNSDLNLGHRLSSFKQSKDLEI